MEKRSFTASLLRASARGYAGLAATRLVERDAALAAPAGFEAWRAHLEHQLAALAAAVEDEAPERFAAHVAWTRDAAGARDGAPETTRAVGLALECLAEVLEESLPPEAWTPLPDSFARAREALARGPAAPESELRGEGRHGELSRKYLDALVAGDERAAHELVGQALDARELTPREALEAVLAPAQREVGRLWHRGELSVAEEHYASQITRRLLTRILSRAPAAAGNGRTVVLSSVAGDAHDLGVQLVAAFFELEGWRTVFLGADTPIEDLVQIVQRLDADLVALGATLEVQRAAAARAIRALRRERPEQRVLVGGAAFAGRADLWRRAGADGYADSPREALRVADELLGS